MADGFAIVQTNEMANAAFNLSVTLVELSDGVQFADALNSTGTTIGDVQTGGGGGYEPLPPEDNMVWGWGA